MTDLLLQFLKLPYPTYKIISFLTIGTSFYVLTLLTLNTLNFFKSNLFKKQLICFITSVCFSYFSLYYARTAFTILYYDYEPLGLFAHLVKIVIQLWLLWKYRTILKKAYILLNIPIVLLISSFIFFFILLNLPATFPEPVIFRHGIELIGTFSMFIIYVIPFYDLVIFPFTFAFLFIMSLPSLNKREKIVALSLGCLCMFSIFLLDRLNSRVINYLYHIQREQPCADYDALRLFEGHALELCEYRSDKSECPKTEHELQSFKPDRYKRLSECYDMEYIFNEKTNIYSLTVSSAISKWTYTFDLNKTGYPDGSK